ncbi:hypothetical protein DH2020_037919 [Rehmannia glutinosa]|uniref:Uncharacterized protein n=1 Tax=Rehmannia glutinosa TaxID=99300 RepID=A0ABR0V1C8_REHGL
MHIYIRLLGDEEEETEAQGDNGYGGSNRGHVGESVNESVDELGDSDFSLVSESVDDDVLFEEHVDDDAHFDEMQSRDPLDYVDSCYTVDTYKKVRKHNAGNSCDNETAAGNGGNMPPRAVQPTIMSHVHDYGTNNHLHEECANPILTQQYQSNPPQVKYVQRPSVWQQLHKGNPRGPFEPGHKYKPLSQITFDLTAQSQSKNK